MSDPTYDKAIIESNPVWKLAFSISEFSNDNAPIGWGNHILLSDFLIKSQINPLKSCIRELERQIERLESEIVDES